MTIEFSPEDFSGAAKLFPLPNLVLFPAVIQPLHIFEPRYRQMMADALKDDRLLAMALLKQDGETELGGDPPIHPVVCLGRIYQEQQLADGRWNLLLVGAARARVLREPPTEKPYRVAEVDLLEEEPIADSKEEARLRGDLEDWVEVWFSSQTSMMQKIRQLLESNLPLGTLCDIFCFTLPMGLDFKQRLLEELDVSARVRMLLDHLRQQGPPPNAQGRKFPPEFSDN